MARVTHLHLDRVGNGQLPIYRPWPETERRRWYQLYEGRWSPMTGHRLLISICVDVEYHSLERCLRGWLDALDFTGSLVFPMRYADRMEGGYQFILAGMGFVPDFGFGTSIQEDPVPILLEACQYDLDLERAHPIVQEAFKEEVNSERFANVMRARRLLIECLSEKQREEFDTTGCFHVEGADGHLYCVKKGFGHNVTRIENGRPVAEYCIIHRDPGVPDYDLMLSQKLMLETMPWQFEAVSNIRLLNRIKIA